MQQLSLLFLLCGWSHRCKVPKDLVPAVCALSD